MNGNEIAGINLMVAAFTLWVAWRQGWLAWAWAFVVEYVRDGQPEQRTREEYARRLDFADGLDIAEAVAAVPELDLDGTQPFAAVFHDDAPARVVPTLVLGDGSYVGLPRTLDVPRPGSERPGPMPATRRSQGPPLVNSEVATGPGYPFHPHAGPPAWRPRHAKTTWVDQLITEALGAPTVEIYMWNWQQRHRLAFNGPRQLTAGAR